MFHNVQKKKCLISLAIMQLVLVYIIGYRNNSQIRHSRVQFIGCYIQKGFNCSDLSFYVQSVAMRILNSVKQGSMCVCMFQNIHTHIFNSLFLFYKYPQSNYFK